MALPPRRSWPLLWRRSRNAVQSVLVLRLTAVLPQSRLRRPPVLLKANSRMQFSRSKTAVTAAILRATRQICPAQWA